MQLAQHAHLDPERCLRIDRAARHRAGAAHLVVQFIVDVDDAHWGAPYMNRIWIVYHLPGEVCSLHVGPRRWQQGGLALAAACPRFWTATLAPLLQTPPATTGDRRRAPVPLV